MIDLAFHESIHRVQKILAVIASMKSQDVGRQHVQQHLPLPRAHAEGLGIGPRDMPEQRDRGLGYLPANQLRQQREVEVLNQNHGTGGVRLRRHHLGELGIHVLIGAPVAGAKRRSHVGQMAQRPKPLIGKTIVVTAFLFFGEPHAAQSVRGVVGRYSNLIVSVHGRSIRRAGAVRHPHARAGAHDGLERRHHAACRHRCHRPMVRIVIVDVGLAVRHDDDLRGAQMIAHHLTQRLRRPVLVKIDFQPLLLLRLGQHLAHLRQYGH